MKLALTLATRVACPQLFLVLVCMLTPLCYAESLKMAPAGSEPQAHTFDVPAQEIRNSIQPPQSIISLATVPAPRGEILARLPGDSTFEKAPANYHVFAAAKMGEDAGVEVLTLKFAGETRLTRIESKNKDFVVEPGGTCNEGNVYSRSDSCALLVRFNPQGPGRRLGFVTITHSAEPTPMSFGLTGNGYAPVISFTPSQITTIPSSISAGTGTISSSTNLAIDGGDILYIADRGNNKLKEMDSTGTIITPALGPIATPASLAADSFGIVYTTNTPGSTYYFSIYYPWGTQTAYGYAYTSSTCTAGAPCVFSAVGMTNPANMSIDAYNNLFFEEGTMGAAEMPVANISGGSGTLNLWHLSDQFAYSSGTAASFVADAYGNIYTKYSFSNTTCYLLQEPLYNANNSPTANRVAGGVSCGFSGDGGQARGAEISSTIGQMAFDTAGNLYFADAGNQRVRRIDALTGIISTIAGNGTAGYAGDGAAATNANLSNPTGVAVDSQGQVYILSNAPTAGPTQAIRKVGTTGSWSFGSLLKGTTSAAKVFTVANTGNDTLTLSANAAISGVNPSDYSIDPATTNCVLTAGSTLLRGQSCKVGILFKPTAAGARMATLVLHDNTISGTNTIVLSGTGTLPAPVFTITSPANGSSFTSGTPVTLSVKVTSVSGPQPTGTVQFKVDGANYGSPVTLSSTGTASTSVTGLTIATHTLSVTYSGDANYAAAGPISVSSIVHAVKIGPIMSFFTVSLAANTCSTPQVGVQVSAASGPVPTGEVELLEGNTQTASGFLGNGEVVLSTHGLSAGQHQLVASYAGDATHFASSLPIVLSVASPRHPCTMHGISEMQNLQVGGKVTPRRTARDE